MRDAATFIASQTASASAGALASVLSGLQAAFRALRRRRQLIQLTEIDDHLLADIGVTREDVRWALDLPTHYDPGVELQRRAQCNRIRGWRERE